MKNDLVHTSPVSLAKALALDRFELISRCVDKLRENKSVYWVSRTESQVIDACEGVMSDASQVFRLNLSFYLHWLPKLEACACALGVIRLADHEYEGLTPQNEGKALLKPSA